MELKQEIRGSAIIITPKGVILDKEEVQKFVDCLTEAFERSGIDRVIINLSELDFLTSSIMSVLIINWYRASKTTGRVFVLSAPDKHASHKFSITHLDGIFPIVQTDEEAIAV